MSSGGGWPKEPPASAAAGGGGQGNQHFYDQIVPPLFAGGKLPEGWQVHIAGPTETGWRIVNVVPSQEEFEAFSREQLGPVLQQLEGVTPELTFFPVYRLMAATSARS